MTGVKVCGMTDPLNVGEIVEAKPDFIGFIFYAQSPRFVGNEPDRSIFDSVRNGIKKVGVFVDEDTKTIKDKAVRFGLDMIQLHGSESADDCARLRSEGITVIKAFNIGTGFDFTSLIEYSPACDFFLFDTQGVKHGGSGEKFDWKLLESYSLEKLFFLSGGIGAGDAGEIRSLECRGLFAVDINSRFEISPGIKDPVKIRTFINAIKRENYEL
jgi:phosphoribosylanthranilate isomerase